MAVRVDSIHAGQHRSLLDSISKSDSGWRSQAFQGMLANIVKVFPSPSPGPQKSVATYTVQKGDTLSGICESALKRAGKSASPPDVDTATKNVARTNKIANMNVISVGQSLDLSSLNSGDTILNSGAEKRRGAVASESSMVSPELKRNDLSHLIQSMLEQRADAKISQPAKALHVGDQVLEQTPDISSGFGVRKDPFTGRSEQHNGVDLAVASGTPVHALKSGTVTFSGWQSNYGKVVVVRHDDGTETLYAHNAKNLVIPGQQITKSTQIAQVGTTGRSTGPHLHFEVRKDGKAIDPMPFLNDSSLQIAKAS